MPSGPKYSAPWPWWHKLSSDRITRAKGGISRLLFGLQILGPNGRRIILSEDVYSNTNSEICYRGTAVPEPDLGDPNFWETKWQDLKDKYKYTIDLASAKIGVHGKLRCLGDSSEGRRILANYELYITGSSYNEIGFRGNHPVPDLEDVMYWKAQEKYLQEKYWEIQSSPGSYLRSRVSMDTEENERYAMWKRANKYESGWVKRKEGIEAWADDIQERGKGYAQRRRMGMLAENE